MYLTSLVHHCALMKKGEERGEANLLESCPSHPKRRNGKSMVKANTHTHSWRMRTEVLLDKKTHTKKKSDSKCVPQLGKLTLDFGCVWDKIFKHTFGTIEVQCGTSMSRFVFLFFFFARIHGKIDYQTKIF